MGLAQDLPGARLGELGHHETPVRVESLGHGPGRPTYINCNCGVFFLQLRLHATIKMVTYFCENLSDVDLSGTRRTKKQVRHLSQHPSRLLLTEERSVRGGGSRSREKGVLAGSQQAVRQDPPPLGWESAPFLWGGNPP